MQGGTASAPPQLNNRNEGHPDTYWDNTDDCHFMVMLQQPDELPKGGPHSTFSLAPVVVP